MKNHWRNSLANLQNAISEVNGLYKDEREFALLFDELNNQEKIFLTLLDKIDIMKFVNEKEGTTERYLIRKVYLASDKFYTSRKNALIEEYEEDIKEGFTVIKENDLYQLENGNEIDYALFFETFEEAQEELDGLQS